MNVFELTAKAVETLFKAQWEAGAHKDVPLAFANTAFNQPDAAAWVRLTVRFGTGIQASLGSRPLEKVPGVAFLQIFVPKGSGTREAYRMADTASTVLRYRQVKEGGVVVDFGAPAVPGEQEDKAHMQVTLNVPFTAQHITGN